MSSFKIEGGQKLGGSALAQIVNRLGTETPTVTDPEYFTKAFNAVQELVANGKVLMKDRRLTEIDEAKVMADCRQAAAELGKRINSR